MISISIRGASYQVEVSLSPELTDRDSIVDGVVVCAKEIREATLEMVRQFDKELSGYIPASIDKAMKKAFIEETLQIVSEQINPAGYYDYLCRQGEKQKAEE